MASPLLDSLPTPEAVADDLDALINELPRYKTLALVALRSLPSVKGWPPRGRRRNERTRSNLGLVTTVKAAIDRFDSPDREALASLLPLEVPDVDLGVRQRGAANLLGVSAETIRKGRQAKMARELADEIFRGEIAWSLDQMARATARQPGVWYRTVEMERTLVIDSHKPTRQTWTTRYLIESLAPAHPIVATTQRWSGSGTDEPGQVRILSGPQPDPQTTEEHPFAHKLLRVRPMQRSAEPYNVYIFDLGEPVPTGDTVELCFEQVLDDSGRTFKPMIGFTTFGMPEVRRVQMRASVPGVQEAKGYELIPVTSVAPNSAGIVPQSYSVPTRLVEEHVIRRDHDGFLTYEVTDDVPDHRYELWWDSEKAPAQAIDKIRT